MTYGRIYPEAGDLHTQPDSSSTDDLMRHSRTTTMFSDREVSGPGRALPSYEYMRPLRAMSHSCWSGFRILDRGIGLEDDSVENGVRCLILIIEQARIELKLKHLHRLIDACA
ncbi:hypothetical protein BDP55DRAFT_632088 [Colletotrichum godetiae]|uniref:Uncharacterized protein n=1 Tax=Colletotrichum godetiae TaxID=1209918 RepID=A0AAJ0EXP4_9PEZI|nr:uncharacterized protein BDP55DRAFT_632088 [Colletotrichum godetiae]KAK1675400.1 hypothetical protein BDP55DRAFT_632088 [Colletotrichum godetiae]